MKPNDKVVGMIAVIGTLLGVVDLIFVVSWLANYTPTSFDQMAPLIILNAPFLLMLFITTFVETRRQSGLSIKAQIRVSVAELMNEFLPYFRWPWRWFYMSCMGSLFGTMRYLYALSDSDAITTQVGEIWNQNFLGAGVIFLVVGAVWVVIKLVWKILRDQELRRALSVEAE
ncbi:MAG TPA: hypothetical protein VLK33_08575 [Terriglobales bacterium]|nr:hypothetical protein [Terriglobales bacterium]